MAIISDEKRIKEITIVLSTRNHTHLGQIFVEDVTLKQNLNSANEISFKVVKSEYNKHIWEDITYLKLVYVVELDEYYEIEVDIADSTDVVKNVTGKSQCEAELGQTILYNIEINTEDDIARKDYTLPTVFYRDLSQYKPDSDEYYKNKAASLLHRILEKAPHYSIGYVQSSLWNIQRSFSVDNTSIYDFLTGDCAEQFDCIFKFDSVTRTVNVYDLETVCETPKGDDPDIVCGHRGIFNDVCPVCGGTKLKYYGEDTTIYVDKENLTEEVDFSTDVGSIKNCFRLEAGDDDMTAAVINSNPNGSAYIYYLSEEQKKDMPKDLVKAIEDYDKEYNSYIEEYNKYTQNMYEAVDKILYYRSSMMPNIEISAETSAREALKKLEAGLNETSHKLSLTKVTSYTSQATVESGLKNYARVYVKSGYFKVEVETTSYTFNKEGDGTWVGKFKITNYSDKEDIAISSSDITMNINDKYEEFINQKIQKYIANNNDDEGTIYQVLTIKTLDKFKEAITYYSLNRLISFRDAIQGVIDIIIELNNPDIKEEFYDPYYDRLVACEEEMDERQATIDEWTAVYNDNLDKREVIQDKLNFQKWLSSRTPEGEVDYYTQFCSYRREDTYSNSNFISDGLDNVTIFDNAKEFIELAKKEIVKSGEAQHSITANLYDLLCMKEFEPLWDKFELGNWIRVRCEDDIYRLRLVSYELNSSSLKNISVEFSDMTKTSNGMNDITSVLSKASSMSSSYSYVSKQASNGNEANDVIDDFRETGLNSAQYRIMNNNDEEITFDKNGILCRERIYPEDWDESQGSCPDYSPEQLKITHNVMCYTTNNWESVKSAFGKQTYTDENKVKHEGYGLNADFVVGGYIEGATIVGPKMFAGEGKKDETTGEYNYPFKVKDDKVVLGGWDVEDTTLSSKDKKIIIDSEPGLDKTFMKVGDNFNVKSDGTVTTNGGTFESGTIIGTTIQNAKENPSFKVDSDGKVIGATIIGSTIQNSEENPTFKVTPGGNIYGATLDTQSEGSTNPHTSINDDGIRFQNNYGYTYIDGKGDDPTITMARTGENAAFNLIIGSGGGQMTLGGYNSISNRTLDVFFNEAGLGNVQFSLSNDSNVDNTKFEVNRFQKITLTGSAGYYLRINDPIYNVKGEITGYQNITDSAIQVVSDRRAKKNITTISPDKSKNFIYSLNPVQYEYINKPGIKHGFIAQDVKEIAYDGWGLVSHDEKEDMFSLSYEDIIADLVAVVQDQHKEIEELKERIRGIENEG